MTVADKEATECDLESVYFFSKDIHESIITIVNSALVQIVEFYEPEELTDDILNAEAKSIAEQTCNVLSDTTKGEMDEETLSLIGETISILIVMDYINKIEPLLKQRNNYGRQNQEIDREEKNIS